MLLHHFAARERVEAISETGLFVGDLPIGDGTHSVLAVSLTTAPVVAGTHAGVLARGGRGAVRITVEIDDNDPALASWIEHRKKLTPAARAGLEKGADWRSWWIYKGRIDPSQFVAVDMIGDPIEETPIDRARLRLVDTSTVRVERSAAGWTGTLLLGDGARPVHRLVIDGGPTIYSKGVGEATGLAHDPMGGAVIGLARAAGEFGEESLLVTRRDGTRTVVGL